MVAAGTAHEPAARARRGSDAHPGIGWPGMVHGRARRVARGALATPGLAVARGGTVPAARPWSWSYTPGASACSRDAMARDPDAAFAYPIQEVTGTPDRFAGAGGDYLLSFSAWEAQRLRRGNYIHAPALIRTDVLRRGRRLRRRRRAPWLQRTKTCGAGSRTGGRGGSCPRCSRDARSQSTRRSWRRCARPGATRAR